MPLSAPEPPPSSALFKLKETVQTQAADLSTLRAALAEARAPHPRAATADTTARPPR